ncbi:MAG: hypothetical protein K2K94_00530 [Muribaculaceae bacterium]|nr:hypothetical protein [Muribaculaceae bacterium]
MITNDNQNSNTPQNKPTQKSRRPLIIVGACCAAVLLIVAGWMVYSTNKALEQVKNEKEQMQLDYEQQQLTQDAENLDREFAVFENSRQLIMDDSVKRDLNEKYENARLQVEALQAELKNQKNKSAAEIKKLKNEIETLRALLRHYVEEINRLNQENEALRTENAQIKEQNTKLNNKVVATSRENEQLSKRMTLAEKLNITGLNLTPLNKKGKKEKKVQKAAQLMVTFTIPQNNSTPVGEKTIYLRIVSPSGQLLGNGGTFKFEGGSVECSAKKIVEYAGEEISGVTIYWDVNTALTAGDYTVELFADNYRLASRTFNLN